MTRARTVTKLPLYRWAELIGISPVHFSGAYVPNIWDYDHNCDDVWTQHSWQRPEVASREHIAELISSATVDIETILGFPVAPTHYKEIVTFPVVQQRRVYPNSIETKWDKLIQFGQYTQTEVDAEVAVTLSDEDLDNFKEIATAVFAYTGDIHELRFFVYGKIDDSYRLYPTVINQVSGIVTVVFNTWDLIKVGLWEKPPAVFSTINLSSESNIDSYVSVYRKYIDPTKPQANLIWKHGDPYVRQSCTNCGGTGCSVCGVTTQPACVNILNANQGLIEVLPATYEENGSYTRANLTVTATPTEVELFYVAGDQNPDYLSYASLNTMKLYWEETITWLSAARLRFPICACGGSKQTVDDLMVNLVEVNKQRQTYVSILSPDMLTNPFGTRYGEVKAWDRVARICTDSAMAGGIL